MLRIIVVSLTLLLAACGGGGDAYTPGATGLLVTNGHPSAAVATVDLDDGLGVREFWLGPGATDFLSLDPGAEYHPLVTWSTGTKHLVGPYELGDGEVREVTWR